MEYYNITKQDIEILDTMLRSIFGTDVWDDDSKLTAQRWLRAMVEFQPQDEMDFNVTTFNAEVNQLITVSEIEFSSLCAHHLFPFVGKAYVGYLPNKKQIGLSKIPRIVHYFATRPCSQEQLTSRIAKFLKEHLEAQGVAVIIEATHTCMSARGIREHNGVMRTSEMRGTFLTSGDARNEFIRLVGLK